jgi:prophage regulatory protein
MTGPIIRLKEVTSVTGLSRSAIYDRMDKNSPRYAPNFPKSFSLDGGAGWYKSEVEAWLKACALDSRHGATTKRVSVPGGAISDGDQTPSPAADRKKSHPETGEPSQLTSGPAKVATSRHKSEPRNLADSIVQGGQINDRMRYLLELKTWTPAMGALLMAGVEAPDNCSAIPNDGIGLDQQPLHAGNRRIAQARHILREWHDWQEDVGDQSTELEPVAFMNWCLRDEIDTEWLHLFLELWGFRDKKSVDLTASRLAMLTNR